MTSPKNLNVGCGKKFHKSWINIDMAPTEREVIPMDLTRKWKIENNEMDVVYNSHVLEHIPKPHVNAFIAECHRVLKPGGIIRIAVPDLEAIARNYIRLLDKNIEQEDPVSREQYDWTMIELYDQVVRNKSQGEMVSFLRQDNLVSKDFLISRSNVADQVLNNELPTSSFSDKINKFKKLRFSVKLYVLKNTIRDFIFTKLMPGKKYYKVGLFRQGGEVHQWMYDQYSLSRLLKEAGFKNIRKVSAFESNIKDWATFELDSSDGKQYKPDSLYMEAEK